VSKKNFNTHAKTTGKFQWGSGVPNIGIILKSADLRRVLGDVKTVDFCDSKR
jgi:hypothetical protein